MIYQTSEARQPEERAYILYCLQLDCIAMIVIVNIEGHHRHNHQVKVDIYAHPRGEQNIHII